MQRAIVERNAHDDESDGVDRGNPVPVPVDPAALLGTWVVNSERADDCNYANIQEQSLESTHFIFQLSEDQTRLDALRCYGSVTNCMDISASERRFPLDENGAAGQGLVVNSPTRVARAPETL